jgi:hypothetical protein
VTFAAPTDYLMRREGHFVAANGITPDAFGRRRVLVVTSRGRKDYRGRLVQSRGGVVRRGEPVRSIADFTYTSIIEVPISRNPAPPPPPPPPPPAPEEG